MKMTPLTFLVALAVIVGVGRPSRAVAQGFGRPLTDSELASVRAQYPDIAAKQDSAAAVLTAFWQAKAARDSAVAAEQVPTSGTSVGTSLLRAARVAVGVGRAYCAQPNTQCYGQPPAYYSAPPAPTDLGGRTVFLQGTLLEGPYRKCYYSLGWEVMQPAASVCNTTASAILP